jgi:hypothetical protein
VSAGQRLISYPEQRALEDAAFAHDAAPTRIFAMLLPVWRVEVKATITDGEPYALIDRYLEHGIAEAGLDTAAGLAAFFSLDEILVERALRFLSAIGHLSAAGGQLALTELGLRSVRDDVRYVVSRQDRRVLYFDALGSRPLTRPYYDASSVTLLSAGAAAAAAARRDGPRFTALFPALGLRAEALAELARNPERDHFNLPARIDDPEQVGAAELAYLPMYVVRAVQRGGRVRLLAYTQAGDGTADPDVSELCERTPEIAAAIDAEGDGYSPGFYERTSQWLDRAAPGGYQLDRLDDGTWRATLPASSFGADAALPVWKVGSFEARGRHVVHVWCDDLQLRRRAMLERIDGYLAAWARPDRAQTEALAARIARQLDLGTFDLATLRELAAAAGKTGLADQLDRLG